MMLQKHPAQNAHLFLSHMNWHGILLNAVGDKQIGSDILPQQQNTFLLAVRNNLRYHRIATLKPVLRHPRHLRDDRIALGYPSSLKTSDRALNTFCVLELNAFSRTEPLGGV